MAAKTKETKMAEKSTKNLKRSMDAAAGTVTMEFGDGRKVVYSVAKSPAEMQKTLMCHGGKQKIGDAVTSAQAEYIKEQLETGKPVDPKRVADIGFQVATDEAGKLTRGVWAERVSTGGIIVLALSRLLKRSLEETQAAWDKLPEEIDPANPKKASKEGYEARPDVKAEVTAIRAERAKAKVKGAGESLPALTL